MSPGINQSYEFGPFLLDLRQRLLLHGEGAVPLTPKLFETLLALVENTGAVVTKDELMSRVWPDAIVEERSLSQNIFLLRKALGENSKGRHYIETVPKVGYRFLGEVAVCGDRSSGLIIEKHDRLRIVSNEEETFIPDETPSVHTFAREAAALVSRQIEAIRKPGRAAAFVLVLLVGSITAVCYSWIASTSDHGSAAREVRSIAILPFKPLSADATDEYLGLGMADTLIGRLSNLRQVVVRPTSAIRRYATREQDPIVAGRQQMVDAVLEGSIQRSADRIRLTVQLVSVRSGAPMWSYQCNERCEDIFAVQDSISEKVAEALTLTLTGTERKLLIKHQTEDTEAYQLYIQGRYFWNKRTSDGFKKALDYFHQASERDSNYALSYVGLADAYTMLADYDWIAPSEAASNAKAAATRALEIDDDLTEAHATLADIRRFFDWDWTGAEREYKRAIQLNPNYSTAHQWYGEFLSAMGRHEEAISEMERAQELDPVSLVVRSAAGWVLLFARKYDKAIEQCRKVIEMDSGFSEAYSHLRRAYEQKGMYREALDADERLRSSRRGTTRAKDDSRNNDTPPDAKGYWQRILELTKQDLKDGEAVEVRLAEAYAQLGEKDKAFERLEKAYENHSCWMPFLRVHPNLDPLRSDVRLSHLLKRLGLED